VVRAASVSSSIRQEVVAAPTARCLLASETEQFLHVVPRSNVIVLSFSEL